MRKGLPWVLGVWFFSAGQLFAQSAPATSSAAGGAPETAGRSASDSEAGERSTRTEGSMVESVPACRSWARVEYLLWWVKNTPVPVPLVTTGDPNVGFDPNSVNTVNTAGAIGQPGTLVLVGDHSIN